LLSATHTDEAARDTHELLSNRRAEFVIIDPASPYEEEQTALAACVDDFLAEGRHLREIILTHHHPDHVGGVRALTEHLKNRTTIAAHRLTAEALRGTISIDRSIEDNEIIELDGSQRIVLRALHTPGHARGHLCFYEERTGAVVTGDMIVGLGSILIDPPEGDMRDYLNSLERLTALPNLSVLFGAHGTAIGNPRAKIAEYIAHRLEREENILRAVREGLGTIPEIVERVYTDVPPKAHGMAARAVLAHLENSSRIISSRASVSRTLPMILHRLQAKIKHTAQDSRKAQHRNRRKAKLVAHILNRAHKSFRIMANHDQIETAFEPQEALQAERREQLQLSEQSLRAITDAMPQLVWATDENGAHTYFNRRWYEYTGFSEEESMGFGFADALHPDDKERTLARWQRAWRDGEPYQIEYRFYSRPQKRIAGFWRARRPSATKLARSRSGSEPARTSKNKSTWKYRSRESIRNARSFAGSLDTDCSRLARRAGASFDRLARHSQNATGH
jgi:PAS domain S-box-containing protein